MFGSTPASLQVASNVRRDTKLVSSTRSGCGARRPNVQAGLPRGCERLASGGKHVDHFQRMRGKARVAGVDRAQQVLAEMDFASFEHSERVGPCNRLDHRHMHVRVALAIAVQEACHHAFDELRRRCDLQRAGLAAYQQACTLAQRVGAAQEVTAVFEQLFAFTRQHEASPYPVEKPESELLLEIGNLPRERRLSHVQPHCCLGDGAHIGDRDERSRVPEIHGGCICRSGIGGKRTYVLDEAVQRAYFVANRCDPRNKLDHRPPRK